MEELKIGIAGIGNMGSGHARSITEGNVPGMKLAAVCDVDKEKLAWAERELPGVLRFETHEDMFNAGLDAVIIATPHYFHPIIAVDAFEAGLNVLTEKPVGVYTENVEKMMAAAEKSGKVFGIMFNQRTEPVYAAAREFVRSGRLGVPKRLNWNITTWYRTQSYYDSGSWRATWAGEGGGVMMNQSVHNIDLWQWIFGMPKSVRGFCSYGKYHDIEVEDDVTVFAEYENGATATFITSTGEYPGTNRLEICGDRAKIVLEDGRMKIWELSSPEREYCFVAEKKAKRPELSYSEPEFTQPGAGHDGILRNFAGAILKGTPLLSPGAEGINSLSIINATYLSDWTGKTVDLPLDGALYKELLAEKRATSKLRDVKDTLGDKKGSHSDRWAVKW